MLHANGVNKSLKLKFEIIEGVNNFFLSGKTHMVNLLIAKGAHIDSTTRDGLTPLHCAARSGHEQVIDILSENNANILSKTKVSKPKPY